MRTAPASVTTRRLVKQQSSSSAAKGSRSPRNLPRRRDNKLLTRCCPALLEQFRGNAVGTDEVRVGANPYGHRQGRHLGSPNEDSDRRQHNRHTVRAGTKGICRRKPRRRGHVLQCQRLATGEPHAGGLCDNPSLRVFLGTATFFANLIRRVMGQIDAADLT